MHTKNNLIQILVVDDSRSARAAISEIFSKAGYSVLSAEDGKTAIEILNQNQINIVVSDLEMPGIDGMELCKYIKSHEQLREIYFIMLSGHESTQDKVTGLNVGADDYIVKSAKDSELRARVRAGVRILNLQKELHNAQLHFFQSEKMASIGQLAAGVAHEINNPLGFIFSNLNSLSNYLNNIQTFMEALNVPNLGTKLQNLHTDLDVKYILKDAKEVIKETLYGADRIKRIVNDLKDFSNVDDAEYQLYDITRGLDSTLSVLSTKFEDGISIIKDYSPIPLLRCHISQMNQVFMNILLNSVASIQDQGEITIKTWKEESTVHISFSDTGCGIPEKYINRIFEPFFTTKEVGDGTGLGLSVAYDIIKQHNGKIRVYSKVNKGTTIELIINI